MKHLILFLLFIVSITIEAYPDPRIQVYEIRKTKENRDVDINYYDPDGFRNDDFAGKFSNKYKNINSKDIDKLIQLISGYENNKKGVYSNKINSNGHNKFKKIFDDDVDRVSKVNRENFDDKEDDSLNDSDSLNELIKYLTRTDEDGQSDSTDVDLTRNAPFIILSVDRHEQPQDVTALGKLLRSPLRTPYEVNEDRTAAPRIRRPYDNDY